MCIYVFLNFLSYIYLHICTVYNHIYTCTDMNICIRIYTYTYMYNIHINIQMYTYIYFSNIDVCRNMYLSLAS